MVLTRTPGSLHLATLAAVEVDGEPYATERPDDDQPVTLQRYRVKPARQGALFPGPRKMDGKASAGALVEAVAALVLPHDYRNPVRGDVLRVGTLAYALTGTAKITDGEGARLIGGADTPANRKRFWRAMKVARWLTYATPAGKPYNLLDVELGKDAVNRLGPPRWWMDKTQRYTLTGALFRPVLAGSGGARGFEAGYWGGGAQLAARRAGWRFTTSNPSSCDPNWPMIWTT